MSWIWALLLMSLTIASGAVAQPRTEHLSILGATSTLGYLRAAVPEWERLHPGYTVSISGGGSVAGVVEVSRGRVDVGVSDVTPQKEWTGGVRLVRVPLGRLPILVIVHPGTGVSRVSAAEIEALMTGRVNSWRQVGGADLPVVVMSRPLASGALSVVEQKMLSGRRVTTRAIVQLSNGAMLAAVRETPGAIGFLESGVVPSGVLAMAIGGDRYNPRNALAWPYFAAPALYYRASQGSGPAADLAHFLGSQWYRRDYGLYGAAS